jgi:hypothetical protein
VLMADLQIMKDAPFIMSHSPVHIERIIIKLQELGTDQQIQMAYTHE